MKRILRFGLASIVGANGIGFFYFLIYKLLADAFRQQEGMYWHTHFVPEVSLFLFFKYLAIAGGLILLAKFLWPKKEKNKTILPVSSKGGVICSTPIITPRRRTVHEYLVSFGGKRQNERKPLIPL